MVLRLDPNEMVSGSNAFYLNEYNSLFDNPIYNFEFANDVNRLTTDSFGGVKPFAKRANFGDHFIVNGKPNSIAYQSRFNPNVKREIDLNNKSLQELGEFQDFANKTYQNNDASFLEGLGESLKKIGGNVGVNDAVDLFKSLDFVNNFGRYSNFQKGLNSAALLTGISKRLGYNQLDSTLTNPLVAANAGHQLYTLAELWDDLNEEQRLLGTSQAIKNIHQGTKALNSFIGGNASSLGSIASSYGAQKVFPSIAEATAAGYTAVGSAQGGGVIAASPGSSAAQAARGSSSGLGNTLSTIGNIASIGAALYGAYDMYRNFGQGGAGGRVRGAANGAAIGTAILPGIGTAIGATIGTGLGSIKSGKHVGTIKRDAYRDFYENELNLFVKPSELQKQGVEVNIIGDKPNLNAHHVQLADGSLFNVGVDSESALDFKDVYNVDKLPEDSPLKNRKVSAYELDLSSDLDFATHFGTQALNLLTTGGSVDQKTESERSQMAAYLANAATSNLDSRDFTEQNFLKAMENVRQFFNKIGIQSNQQGLQLLDGLFGEGRVNEDDANAIRIGLDFVFNNNFNAASRLNTELGRSPLASVNTSQGVKSGDNAQQSFSAEQQSAINNFQQALRGEQERLNRLGVSKEDDIKFSGDILKNLGLNPNDFR